MLARPGADALGEEAQPDAHVLAALPPLGLLRAQLVVAGDVQRQLQRARVVARVVLPAGRRRVRELVRPQQVAHPQLGRVGIQLAREQVDQPFDQVDRLGHAERAGVRDPARRLGGVHAGHLAVRGAQVIRPGEDVEEPGRELGRLRGRVERAVVREHPRPQPEDPPVRGRRDLAVHVVIPGERAGHEVLGPVLEPLHRPARLHRRRDRAQVARVHRDLVAETAAEVGRDNADLVLRQPGDGRVHRPVRMRCLAGHPDGELPAHLVQVRHDAAGLQRRGMGTGVHHVAVHDDIGGRERGIGGGLVPGAPVEDAVIGPAGQVVADQRCRRRERGAGVDDRRQRLVLDRDQLQRVPGRVPVPRDDERDLLALEPDLVGREHGLHVAGQRRHPGQALRLQVGAGQHGLDHRVRLRRGDVDGQDPGVRVRTAQDRPVQHAWQPQVVDERALAADEARVFLARDRPVRRVVLAAHPAASASASAWLAHCTDLTMFS